MQKHKLWEGECMAWEEESLDYNIFHRRSKIMCAEILARSPHSVLELGCGIGVLRAEILKRDSCVDYFGCDISRAAIEMISDQRVACVDLNHDQIPFSELQFSCVAGSGILEYIHDVHAILLQINERLVNGGSLIVSYYNYDSLYRRGRRSLGLQVRTHPAMHAVHSLASIEARILDSGFSIVKRIPVDVSVLHPPRLRTDRGFLCHYVLPHVPAKELWSSQIVYVAIKDRNRDD